MLSAIIGRRGPGSWRNSVKPAFLMSNPGQGLKGGYSEPAPDLTLLTFASSLVARVAAFSGRIQQL
jgi:hypothetical protein